MESSVKPFTVIGGFLGAGKTTLLNHLLASSTEVRYAVLVNDFGAINIDEQLIERHDGQTLALSNGCICCSMVGGFITTMLNLMQQPDAFDHIIVEASGVAEPDKIMDFARIDPTLSPEGIVVLIDAGDIQARLADEKVENVVRAQLSTASILLVNKTDQTDPATLQGVKTMLRTHNASAVITQCRNALVPLELLFGHALPQTSRVIPQSLESVATDDRSDHPFVSHSVEFPRPINRDRFELLRSNLAANIVRAKGIVRFTDDSDAAWLWQRTGGTDTLSRWAGTAEAGSKVVFIGSGDLSATIEQAGEVFQ